MSTATEPMFITGLFNKIIVNGKEKLLDKFEETFDPNDVDNIDLHKNRIIEGYANTNLLDRVDDVVEDVKDNRHGISKLWVWLVTALVTILTAVVGLVLGL